MKTFATTDTLNRKTINQFHRLLPAVSAVALLGLSLGANAVPFTITAAQFLPGAGYGIDIDESSGVATELDVRFLTSAFTMQNFALNAVNQSFTFNFGTIDLEEPDAHSGIIPNEVDGLDISARLTFTAPAGVIQTITATGVATVGSVSDAFVDYVIDWSPVTVLFGNGGAFSVSLTDMALDDQGSQFQTVTVTLLSLPDASVRSNDVPEPTSMALLGAALAGLGFSRRKDRTTSLQLTA